MENFDGGFTTNPWTESAYAVGGLGGDLGIRVGRPFSVETRNSRSYSGMTPSMVSNFMQTHELPTKNLQTIAMASPFLMAPGGIYLLEKTVAGGQAALNTTSAYMSWLSSVPSTTRAVGFSFSNAVGGTGVMAQRYITPNGVEQVLMGLINLTSADKFPTLVNPASPGAWIGWTGARILDDIKDD